jgi:HEAT repeat protein
MSVAPRDTQVVRRRAVSGGSFSRKEMLAWRPAIHEARIASDTATAVQFLAHTDAEARMLAAGALRKIGDPSGIEPLRRLLYSESEGVQCNVIRALGKLQDEGTREQIYKLATGERVSAQVQGASLRALGDMNDQRAVPILTEILVGAESTGPARRFACRELVRQRATAAIPALDIAARHGSFVERRRARKAIKSLRRL